MELDGTIVGKFGRAGKAPGEFATIHQMDCRDPNVIYTAEINDWRSQKIVLEGGLRLRCRRPRQAALVVDMSALRLRGWSSLSPSAPASDMPFDRRRLPEDAADIYVGEVGGVGANSKGQIFVYTRTGHPYATLGDNRTFLHGGSRLFQFDPTGKFVRELGQDVYGFNAAIGLRVDPQDNVWTIDAAASQVVKFDPDGPRRARARTQAGKHHRAAGATAAGRAGEPPAAGRLSAAGRAQARRGPAEAAAERVGPRSRHAGIELQPAVGRRLGSRRQHLRGRRPRHQQSRREVRQGRPLHRALGLDRQRPGPVQRREGDRHRRAGQRLRRRHRQQANPGLRRAGRVQVGVRRMSARRARCA